MTKKPVKKTESWRVWLALAVIFAVDGLYYALKHDWEWTIGIPVVGIASLLYRRYGKSDFFDLRPEKDERHFFMLNEAYRYTVAAMVVVLLGGMIYEIACGKPGGPFSMLFIFQCFVFTAASYWVRQRT